MTPVLGWERVRSSKEWQARCEVCGTSGTGSCVSCCVTSPSTGSCGQAFHPMCGRRAGYRMEMNADSELVGFCRAHGGVKGQATAGGGEAARAPAAAAAAPSSSSSGGAYAHPSLHLSTGAAYPPQPQQQQLYQQQYQPSPTASGSSSAGGGGEVKPVLKLKFSIGGGAGAAGSAPNSATTPQSHQQQPHMGGY